MTAYIAITDANLNIGTGHVMRQIYLAQIAIQSNIDTIIVSHSLTAEKICKANKIPFILARSKDEIEPIILKKNIRNLIIDVHERDFPLYEHLSKQFHTILIVSEVGFNFPPFGEHLVRIGSNLCEWDSLDQIKHQNRKTLIHSGRAWMIYKKDLIQYLDESKRESQSILICHGGSDPYKLTRRCLKALEYTQETHNCYILVTDLFSDIDQIYSDSLNSKHTCKVIMNTDSPAYWMQRSKCALINGGNVRYELCITKTPFVAISFQQKQFDCTDQISSLGAGINLGVMNNVMDTEIAYTIEHLLNNKNKWDSMHEIMGRLFDLNGSQRILCLLTE